MASPASNDPHRYLAAAIKRYIERPQPYAVLITGAWGSGKTHFWKREITPELEKSGKQVLYTSLFGLTRPEELSQRMLEARWPKLKSTGGKVTTTLISGALAFVRAGELEKKLPELMSVDPDRDVLCFDDLERCRPEALVPVLARISNYVEHSRVPVIVLANEAEMNEQSEYRRFREKLVGAAHTFQPRLRAGLQGLIADLPIERKQTKELLGADSSGSLIERVCSTPNLRLLRIALQKFDVLDEVAVATDLSYATRMHLLLTCIAVTWEIGKDATIAAELAPMLSFALQDRQADTPTVAVAESLEAARRIAALLEIHGAVTSPLLPAVYQFLTDGLFTDEARAQLQRLDVSRHSAPKSVLNPDFWRLDAGAFNQGVSDVVTRLRDPTQRMSLLDIVTAANWLHHFATSGALPNTVQLAGPADVLALARTRIEQLLKSIPSLYDGAPAVLTDQTPYVLAQVKWQSASAQTDAFAKDVTALWQLRKAELTTLGARKLCQDLLTGRLDFDQAEEAEGVGLFDQPLLASLDMSALAQQVLGAQLRHVDEFEHFLAARYVSVAPGVRRADAQALGALSNNVAAALPAQSDPLVRYRLQRFASRLQALAARAGEPDKVAPAAPAKVAAPKFKMD